MNLLARMADRFVLCPTTHPVDAGESQREMVDVDGVFVEAWTDRTGESEGNDRILMIKFPGTGGRAERSTLSPCHLWEGVSSEVWTINPFGYGGSEGTASLQSFPKMIDSIYKTLRTRFANHKIVVYGNSLGTISALAMAAHHQVDGLYLRNCVPIHQLIASRPKYAWPSLGLSRFIANQIPARLNAVENSSRVSVPCLFVMSEKDRVVPARFQHQIIDVFAGPQKIFTIPDAGHQDSIPESLADSYIADLKWLQGSIFEVGKK